MICVRKPLKQQFGTAHDEERKHWLRIVELRSAVRPLFHHEALTHSLPWATQASAHAVSLRAAMALLLLTRSKPPRHAPGSETNKGGAIE